MQDGDMIEFGEWRRITSATGVRPDLKCNECDALATCYRESRIAVSSIVHGESFIPGLNQPYCDRHGQYRHLWKPDGRVYDSAAFQKGLDVLKTRLGDGNVHIEHPPRTRWVPDCNDFNATGFEKALSEFPLPALLIVTVARYGDERTTMELSIDDGKSFIDRRFGQGFTIGQIENQIAMLLEDRRKLVSKDATVVRVRQVGGSYGGLAWAMRDQLKANGYVVEDEPQTKPVIGSCGIENPTFMLMPSVVGLCAAPTFLNGGEPDCDEPIVVEKK